MGDWVVIEFGINDAGTLPPYPTPDAKGRIDCGGVGLLPAPISLKS